MPSSPQTITVRGVFDYLYNSAGKAIVGATVNCTLNFNGASVTSPIVNVGELQQATTTDQNGFWRFNLVPNDTLTPSGTLYTIVTPNASYEISVPSGGADVQSSSILANTPSVLSPAATNLTGPITVTGNETVTGNLSVSGTTTLGSTTTGALTTAAETVGGDLTISSAFRLLFGAAVSKIIPGATSISLRDNADANDNLIVTNAGNVTIRGSETITGGGWTLTAGDAVITAGRLLLNAAAAKIKGGATSLSLRNSADSADNLLITDAGLATLRNALLIPPSAGGTLVTSGYGSVPIKVFDSGALGADATSIDTGAAWLTTGLFTQLRMYITCESDQAGTQNVVMRINNDSGANYFWGLIFSAANGTPASNGAAGSTSGVVAAAVASTTGNWANFTVVLHDVSSSHHLSWEEVGFRPEGGALANLISQSGGGIWTGTGPVTRLTFLADDGVKKFKAGSRITIEGIP